jgi:hypothetical protein
MKKVLVVLITILSTQAISAQRGGHFGGGSHFAGQGFSSQRFRGHTYISQGPRITGTITPNIVRQSTIVSVEPRHNFFSRGIFGRHEYVPYVHRGVNFYYNRGFFYDSYYNWFYPPIGFALMSLPFGYYNFTYGGNPYYYYGGVYYIQNNNQYEVVSPVIGAIVPELPKETKVIIIDGKKCYVTKDNVYYEEYVDGNVLKYKVIGKEEK